MIKHPSGQEGGKALSARRTTSFLVGDSSSTHQILVHLSSWSSCLLPYHRRYIHTYFYLNSYLIWTMYPMSVRVEPTIEERTPLPEVDPFRFGDI